MTAATVPMRYREPAKNPGNYGRLLEKRVGIMLHYDESASDDGAIGWLLFDPACKVSYTRIVLDDGTVRQVAPDDARAWHAGACRPSDPRLLYKDANSAFFGLAIAAKHTEKATEAQYRAVIEVCVHWFRQHGWTRDETFRITGHRAEAWPRGRKDDPDGKLGEVLLVSRVRELVAEALR
jgi:N-acetyl-anhydromuramyl-L-alanine amidase AmpD